MLDIKSEVLMAEKRIRAYIKETPLDYSVPLSKLTQANVYLKCENLQYTGAFKLRGAMNKLLSLTPAEREQGVVAASSGNHGAAIAYCLNKLNMKGIIFVPDNASSTKVDNIHNYTQQLEFYGKDMRETEIHAMEYAKKQHMIYVSPYNNPKVIGGQGTIGLELVKQLKHIDAVFVAIGGGGLMSGIAGYVKSVHPAAKMIGCLPLNSPVMLECMKAGKIIEMKTLPTISDATAGGIEPDAITFDLCRQLVDDYCLVTEEDIKNAIISLIKTQHLLVEGAAGVALAAFVKTAQAFQGKNVVIILSGANIGFETLKSILVSC